MKFGHTDISLMPIGLGCWAIGGLWYDLGTCAGWGDVCDEESLRALDTGIGMGVNLIDTANVYGAGHSEALVGKAIEGRRDQVFISTKFGIEFDPATKTTTGKIKTPQDIIRSCEDSLRRLNTDYIDLFLFHLGDFPIEEAAMVRDTLEKLAGDGKIRYYGWSTSDPARQAVFAEGKHYEACEFALNVLEDDPAMCRFVEETGITGLCRSPLAMGLLTGKYNKAANFSKDDLRGKNAPVWMTYFVDGKPNEVFLKKLEAIREILTSNGRTLAQGCLGWILGRNDRFVPIPGFKRVEQVKENVGALEKGPLTKEQIAEIDRILRVSETVSGDFVSE